jgi:hypothetical protein
MLSKQQRLLTGKGLYQELEQNKHDWITRGQALNVFLHAGYSTPQTVLTGALKKDRIKTRELDDSSELMYDARDVYMVAKNHRDKIQAKSKVLEYNGLGQIKIPVILDARVHQFYIAMDKKKDTTVQHLLEGLLNTRARDCLQEIDEMVKKKASELRDEMMESFELL